jgi:hypothetical protein
LLNTFATSRWGFSVIFHVASRSNSFVDRALSRSAQREVKLGFKCAVETRVFALVRFLLLAGLLDLQNARDTFTVISQRLYELRKRNGCTLVAARTPRRFFSLAADFAGLPANKQVVL